MRRVVTSISSMARSHTGSRHARALAVLPLLLMVAASAGAQSAPEIPAHNRADQEETPPRPSDDAALQALGRTLLEAIEKDDPAIAEPIFFPRAAFLQVKAMRDPGRYWDRLHARFAQDIHALHAQHVRRSGGHAELVRLALSRRGGFVRVGEEGNRLPYWAARHNTLTYRLDSQERTLEVRVLITWDDRFYVIHLSEFR